jgi:RNA polymerase sigma-70 factor (ECF subfamily)
VTAVCGALQTMVVIPLTFALRLPAPPAAATLKLVTQPSERDTRLRAMVDRYLDFVARVLRNAGTPEAEIDDDVQRTFIAVANRLDDVRPDAEKSFILQTALRMAAHARRTLARRRETHDSDAQLRIQAPLQPEQMLDQKRARELLDEVLEQMALELRTVFVLYELEELSMTEIAAALRIPQGTVASRLRRARADFRDRVRALSGSTHAEVGS